MWMKEENEARDGSITHFPASLSSISLPFPFFVPYPPALLGSPTLNSHFPLLNPSSQGASSENLSPQSSFGGTFYALYQLLMAQPQPYNCLKHRGVHVLGFLLSFWIY